MNALTITEIENHRSYLEHRLQLAKEAYKKAIDRLHELPLSTPQPNWLFHLRITQQAYDAYWKLDNELNTWNILHSRPNQVNIDPDLERFYRSEEALDELDDIEL